MAAKAGQQTVTTSAAALPQVSFTAGPVTLKAPKANAAAIEIGPTGETASTGFVMDPGDQVTLACANLAALSVVGANTSDKITWIGF